MNELKEKRAILVFIDWYYPAFKAGGPIKSLSNLLDSLSPYFKFYVVTSNQEIDGSTIKIESNKWISKDSYKVIYLDSSSQNKSVYKSIYEEIKPSQVYYNSLYSKNFTLKPYSLFKKYKIPQLIAPRGMLGKGALMVKPLKKKVFLFLAKRLFFEYENTFWHATSDQEVKDIKAIFGENVKVKQARNLSSNIVDRPELQVDKKVDELRMVFVSRILPIKNLLFLLDTLQTFDFGKSHISLDIYGPIEDENYWDECKEIINRFDTITYKGELKPDEIQKKLQEYHFYVLPTKHENFGNAIVESWLSGVPVIISDKTPWTNLQIKLLGASLSLSNEQEWVDYINYASASSLDQYIELVRSCKSFSEKELINQDVLNDNLKLFGL